MSTVTDHFKSPTFLLKIVEIVFSSIAISLFVSDPLWGVGWTSRLAVIFGTLIGFIMIPIIIIITTVLNSPMHRYAMLMIAFAAAFLFFASGGLIFQIVHNATHTSGYLIGAGIFACFNGCVYIADCVITLKYAKV